VIFLARNNNIERLISVITEKGPNRVFLQIPAGLKTKLVRIMELLDEKGIDVFASLDPCYGACDLKDVEAERMGCDLLVHVGHTKFCESDRIDVVYFPWMHMNTDPVQVIGESLADLEDYRRIGIVASVNFLPVVEETEEFLKSKNFDVFVGESSSMERGQIIGCDVSSALSIEEDVDCYLYLGSGIFHPLGLGLETSKPIFRLDFEEGRIKRMDFDKFQRQRIIAVERAKDAEKFGILVSTKKCQSEPEVALSLKEMLTDLGKEAHIFTMDMVTKDKLEGLDLDCLVNAACPRIAIENRTSFGIPILNVDELQKAVENQNFNKL